MTNAFRPSPQFPIIPLDPDFITFIEDDEAESIDEVYPRKPICW